MQLLPPPPNELGCEYEEKLLVKKKKCEVKKEKLKEGTIGRGESANKFKAE